MKEKSNCRNRTHIFGYSDRRKVKNGCINDRLTTMIMKVETFQNLRNLHDKHSF